MADTKDTTRRGTMLAALGLTAVALPVAAAAAASPDAALIAACDAYRGLMDALNHGEHGEDEDGPVNRAYYACCDTISSTPAQTMAGMLAKCRAIKAEARGRDGEPIAFHGTMAEDWAADVVDAVLRLNGGAA